MLRITVQNGSQPTTLKLEGKLSGPWVGEVERTWLEFSKDTPGKSVTVDLSGVTTIDSEGRELLGRILRQGAAFRTAGVMMKHIVDEIARAGGRRPQGGGLTCTRHMG